MKKRNLTAIILSTAMLAGCGSSTSSSATKTYRFAADQDITTMDSAFATDPTSMNALHATNEGLMAVGKKGDTVAGLAKSYKLSKNRKVYTFTLRDNLKWTDPDGKTTPLKAQDFVYSWRRALGQASEYAYMFSSDGAGIKNADKLVELGTKATKKQLATLGISAPDDKTVKVTLERPCSYFLDIMTFSCFYPQSEKYITKWGKSFATDAKHLLTCGAFQATNWVKSSKITFKKNNNYYDKKDVKIDNLTMYLNQDPKTSAANFEAGKVDFATINSSLVDKYKSNKAYTQFAQGYVYYININFKKKLLANKNIRAALSYAINRKDFTSNVLKDGSQPIGGMVGRTIAYNPKTHEDFRKESGNYVAYDLKKAQSLFDKGLKELGMKSASLEILYGTDESPENTVAEYLQHAFSQLKGLKVDVKASTRQGRIQKQDASQYDIALQHWGPDYSDPTTYLNLGLSNNSNNRGKYNNPKFDAAMKAAQKESDAYKRWNDLLKAEKIEMKDYAFIPLFQKGAAALQNPKTSGLIYKMALSSPYTFTYVQVK